MYLCPHFKNILEATIGNVQCGFHERGETRTHSFHNHLWVVTGKSHMMAIPIRHALPGTVSR